MPSEPTGTARIRGSEHLKFKITQNYSKPLSAMTPHEAFLLLAYQILPVLGILTSLLLALGPLRRILDCRNANDLGCLNPIPCTLLLGNSVGMVMYSTATRNATLFLSNIGSVMLSIFYVLSAYGLCTCPRTRRKLEIITISLAALWCTAGFSAAMVENRQTGILILGVVANVVVLLLFASPLSGIAEIIQTRNSRSIDRMFASGQVTQILATEYFLKLNDWKICIFVSTITIK